MRISDFYQNATLYGTDSPIQPLYLGALGVNIPTQSGTPANATFAAKRRYLDWAGTPGKYFFRSGTAHITNIDFGTRTADTPSNTALSAYVTDTEGGGAQPALFSPVLANGIMTMAGGRVVQTADGKIRLQQFADDALFVNCPRVQLWTATLPVKKRLVHEFTFQIGDATTPCPVYDAGGKNNILVWQLKGGTVQPPISMNIKVMPDNSLRLDLSRKMTQAGVIWFATTNSMVLQPNTPIAVKIEFSIDWQVEAEGGTAFLALDVNGTPIEIFHSDTTSEGLCSIGTPTAITDYSTLYQVMIGIYRYDYSAVKAPNDSCMVIHKSIIYRKFTHA